MEPQKRKPKVRMFRFLRCFNPNGVVSRERKTPDPLLTYIAVPEKHMLPTVLTSAFKTAKGGEGNASHRKKTDRDKNDDSNNNSNRSFRRALMSALNHTSLGKKMGSKKKTNKGGFSRESSKNSSNCSPYSFGSLGFTTNSISSSTSTTLSIISTGTVTSTTSCEPCLTRSLAMANGTRIVKRKDEDGRRWCSGSNIALSMFFITALLILILWGRCYAIAYTAIGFFVVPNRRRTCEEETQLISSVRFKT